MWGCHRVAGRGKVDVGKGIPPNIFIFLSSTAIPSSLTSQSYRGHSPMDSLRDESLGETSYTILIGTPGPWENVKLILLGILLGSGP